MYQDQSVNDLLNLILFESKKQLQKDDQFERKKKPKQIPSSTKFFESDYQSQECFPDHEEVSAQSFGYEEKKQEEKPKQTQEVHNNPELIPMPPPKAIFVSKNFDQQNKNTPRFLVRLAVKYLKCYKDDYPEQIYKIVSRECEKLQEWHLSDKSNVYLISHLKFLFSSSETFTKEGIRLNRKVYRKILLEYAKQELEDPKSQVKSNKIDYYRACKVFGLRCMNEDLVKRNQTR